MSTLKKVKAMGSAVSLSLLLSANVVCCQSGTDEQGGTILKTIAEVPLPGPAVRFDPCRESDRS